ncbi:MAG: cysteine--tRNA ligase, partial [Chloroflexota bacterium]|nr:cysteine--tRNA ligase [Chloroflexota bacterium]
LDTGEDRILKGARRERVEPMELVETYTRRYFEDMDRLNVRRPDISPRASGHIPEQIELVKRLLERGYAYEVNGNVYFEVSNWPEYGRLSGRRVEELQEGARVEVREEKRNPADFALWKRAEPEHIMRWPSPWGEGYPGWHVECSVMSTKYLGQPFDIHGGGVENKFPHHDGEIAQSEAGYGLPLCRYWLHNGMLMFSGEEMHKSLGNMITLRQAFEQYDPLAIRFFILGGNYRNPLDFTGEAMEAADKGLRRILGTVRAVRGRMRPADEADEADAGVLTRLEEARTRFGEAMDDDFNTPQAVAVLFDLGHEVNSWLNSGQPLNSATLAAIDALYLRLGGDVLGIVPDELPEEAGVGLTDDLVRILIEMRAEARDKKDWATADAIRDRLTAIGIALEDGPEGTGWRLAR